MHHLYISVHANVAALQKEREALVSWCVKNGVTDYDFIEDNLAMGRIPDKIIRKLLKPIQFGDTIIVADISRLGRSLGMLQIVMNYLRDNECSIITLEGRTMEPNRTMALFVNSLNDIVEIERRIKAFRSIDILHTKRGDGIVIGRPQGAKRRPEKTVLYGKEEQLRILAAAGHTDKEIASKLSVSSGTVTNYRKAQGIVSGAKIKKGT